MDMALKRIQFRHDGIFSELLDAGGNHICFTLEHAYPVNGSGFQPKMPNGVYECVRGIHQLSGMKAPFETFEITGVQGHTNILFHVGNFNNDSEGCVLLGEEVIAGSADGIQVLSQSKTAFATFLGLQSGKKTFTLTVIDYFYPPQGAG